MRSARSSVFRSFTGAAPLKREGAGERADNRRAVFRSFTGAAPLKRCQGT